MRRMLEELYHGNITPNVKAFIKDTEYSKALETVSKNENALTGTIFGNKKAENLLDDLIKAQDTVNSITGSCLTREAHGILQTSTQSIY